MTDDRMKRLRKTQPENTQFWQLVMEQDCALSDILRQNRLLAEEKVERERRQKRYDVLLEAGLALESDKPKMSSGSVQQFQDALFRFELLRTLISLELRKQGPPCLVFKREPLRFDVEESSAAAA